MTVNSVEPETCNSFERVKGVSRRIATALGKMAMIATGGMLATNVFPSTTTQDGISVTSVASFDPGRINQIYAKTPVGEIQLNSSRLPWAPGIEVTPEVTATLLNGSGGLLELGLYQDALSEIAKDQSQQIGVKLIGGGAMVAAGLALAGANRRREKASNRQVVVRVASGLAATALVPGIIYGSYANMTPDSLKMTGLLAEVAQAPGMLQGIDAQQVEHLKPYVEGWLNLANLAKDQLGDPSETQPTAIRLLFVSDIHGRNQYELMKEIIDRNTITAVIDTGDIVNFGRSEELEITKMTQGIESLGVPYLFVRGNHDSLGPNDFSLTERLAREAENVILLQPDDSTFNVANLGGYSVAGLDSQGYNYGSEVADLATAHQPYVARFNEAIEGQQIDLTLGHDPVLTEHLPGILKAHGHTHQPSFDGKTINPGTFTGGDVLRSARATAEAAKKRQACDTEQQECDIPASTTASYAMLDIGGDCLAKQVMIITYRYPQGSDGQSSLMGQTATIRRVDTPRQSHEPRTCSANRGVTTQKIQVDPIK